MIIGIDCYHLKDQKGIERYMLNLLSFWKKEKNINFILYVDQNKILKKLPKSDNFRVKILKIFDGKAVVFDEKLKNIFQSTTFFQHWLLPRQAKKDKIDILFSPSYLLPFLYKGKTAVTIHDIIYETHPEWFLFHSFLDKVLIKWMGRRTAKKADIVFVPSEFTKQEIDKSYKICNLRQDVNNQAKSSFCKVVVTPLAPDNIFKQTTKDKKLIANKLLKRQQAKKKYGIKQKFFLFAAAIFDRRCVVESILAFKKIAKKYPNFQYLIIGKDFTRAQSIKALVEKTNLQLKKKAIIYEPTFVENDILIMLYKEAYALIYLSLYEGFGLPVIEGQFCSVPVITSKGTSLEEVAIKGSVLRANPKDSQEIASIMEKIIKNENNLRTKLIQTGHQNIKRFSWEKCAKQTLETLKSLSNK